MSTAPIPGDFSRKARMVSPAGVTYSVETITPVRAEAMLGTNYDNRSLREAHVVKYASDMAAGIWPENGSAIVFDADGNLIDGQHRLAACVQSGAAFTTLVVRDVPRMTQNTIDDGVKRTISDRFAFEGYPSTHIAASVCRRVLLYQDGRRASRTSRYNPSTREFIELYQRDRTVAVAVNVANRVRRGGLLPASVIGFTHWLMFRVDPDDCHDFWTSFETGAGLDAESPVLVLRNQLTRLTQDPNRRVSETTITAWVVKAWNDYRENRPRRAAYTHRVGDAMPEVR